MTARDAEHRGCSAGCTHGPAEVDKGCERAVQVEVDPTR